MTARRRWLDRVDRPSRPTPSDLELEPAPAEPPVVPFVPVLCPRCREPKPITDGVHDTQAGRTRYHVCKGCSLKFRSLEFAPEQVAR